MQHFDDAFLDLESTHDPVTDSEREQSEGEQTDASSSVVAPSGTAARSEGHNHATIFRHVQEDESDVFGRYSFKGRQSVIIDGPESGDDVALTDDSWDVPVNATATHQLSSVGKDNSNLFTAFNKMSLASQTPPTPSPPQLPSEILPMQEATLAPVTSTEDNVSEVPKLIPTVEASKVPTKPLPNLANSSPLF